MTLIFFFRPYSCRTARSLRPTATATAFRRSIIQRSVRGELAVRRCSTIQPIHPRNISAPSATRPRIHLRRWIRSQLSPAPTRLQRCGRIWLRTEPIASTYKHQRGIFRTTAESCRGTAAAAGCSCLSRRRTAWLRTRSVWRDR